MQVVCVCRLCVCVLGVGGGVWETLHSARVMNSAAPESVFYNSLQQRFN